MKNRRVPAVFMRGGTSKAVVFHARDLPESQEERDAIFLHVLGSPDPNQRQLDGMGGGISSLSKIVIVEPSDRLDVEIDYTFAQVAVDAPVVDYSGICGNMSAAVGPFAVDEGLLEVKDGEAVVRIYNTNTGKVYHSRFTVAGGKTVEDGDFSIPGVPGFGACIRLDYLNPGGTVTSGFLPSGKVCDRIEVEELGSVEVTVMDVTNPVVFVQARDLGFAASEPPDLLESDTRLMHRLDVIRRKGGVLMGMAGSPEAIPLGNPKIAMVGPAAKFTALDGSFHEPEMHDISIRIVSMESIHRAITLTGAMCTAAAAKVDGSVPHVYSPFCTPLRIGNPSGILPVDTEVRKDETGCFTAISATCYRTQRRIMEGFVFIPDQLARNNTVQPVA